MTDQQQPATPASDARLSDEPLEYVCAICGWQYKTMNGLWDHIPLHHLTPVMYGTLYGQKTRLRLLKDQVVTLRADLAVSRAETARLREALVRLIDVDMGLRDQITKHLPDGPGIALAARGIMAVQRADDALAACEVAALASGTQVVEAVAERAAADQRLAERGVTVILSALAASRAENSRPRGAAASLVESVRLALGMLDGCLTPGPKEFEGLRPVDVWAQMREAYDVYRQALAAAATTPAPASGEPAMRRRVALRSDEPDDLYQYPPGPEPILMPPPVATAGPAPDEGAGSGDQ